MLQRTVLKARFPATRGLFRTTAFRAFASPATHIPAGSKGSIKTVAATSSAGAQHLESNVPSETNRLEKTAERFWEKVSVAPSADGESLFVQLDGKSIKTPKGLPLAIPARKKALAHLIAQEWRVLPNLKIKPHSLQLTSLAARAVDLEVDIKENGGDLVKDDIVDALLPYLDTDTLLVFAPIKDCEGTLRPAQEEVYRGIIKQAEQFWANGVILSWLDTEICIAGNTQSEETKKVVGEWIRSLDTWQLVALERATMTAKSLISGMNIATRRMSVEDVSVAATLETIHQTKVWGEVEDTHDVDYHDIRRSLGSAYLLASDY